MTNAAPQSEPPALVLAGIVKRFGAVTALNGASLAAQEGTIHALLGENGAGKTTLMRIAFGMVRADSGRLLLHGQPVLWRSPADAIAAGIGMVHQHFTSVPAMTVAENVELSTGSGRHWRFDRRTAEARVRTLSTRSGLEIDPRARVSELSIASQQRVEILKSLSREARVLILDEPTAVLAPAEVAELLRWLRTYADAGRTAILITHKLREALAVADDITVLRRGRSIPIADRSAADEQELTKAMIGEQRVPRMDTAEDSDSGLPSRAVPVASLDAVLATDRQHREVINATLDVYAGEILGIAGIDGAGQRVLLRVLAGRITPISGRFTRPASVGFVPEDRHRDGLILSFSIVENVALRGAGQRRGRLVWASIRRRTAALVREYDVRTSAVTALARTLSGGNQQRLVVARELDEHPALIVAENPTRGLDVRATADVHGRLRSVRNAGGAVVVYSSDLDEVIALADRVLVVHAGTVREVPPDKDLVGRAMLGLAYGMTDAPRGASSATQANRPIGAVSDATVARDSGDTHPARWRMLALLATAETLGMSLWFAASAVASSLAGRWDVSASTGAAWLTTAVQVGFVAGTAAAAVLNLADLIPGARYFAASAALGAAANAALLVVGDFQLALVTRFLTGFFLAGVYPPAIKMVATWFRARRGLAIGTIVGALTVGKATPYLVLALTGAVTSTTMRGNEHTAWVVIAASAGALAAAILIFIGYRDGPHPFQPRPFSWRLVADVWQGREWRLATSGYLGHMWELYAFWTWIPAFLAASFGAKIGNPQLVDSSFIAAIAFITIAVGGVGCVWGGVTADRTGRERLVVYAMAASGSCALFMPVVFGQTGWLLTLFACVWSFFVIADSAQFSALVTESVSPHAVGTALTLQTSLGFLLTTFSIQLVPPIVELVGWQWAFPILAVGPVLGIIAIRKLVALKRSVVSVASR